MQEFADFLVIVFLVAREKRLKIAGAEITEKIEASSECVGKTVGYAAS